MLYIFHGDDDSKSRQAINLAVDQQRDSDVFKREAKETNPLEIEQFLASPSFFFPQKVVLLYNCFSLPKATLDKLQKVIDRFDTVNYFLWQDKKLTATQLKIFPQAKVTEFPLPQTLFAAVNAVKPKNTVQFINLYHAAIIDQPFELLLYLIKGSLRRQLTSFTKFDQSALKRAYLNLIQLDYQNKTGQLTIPKEMALERVILQLIQ